MKNKYQPQNFEKKWIGEWGRKKVYQADQPSKQKKKMYTLVMFPYPSGEGLHVGHARVYTGTDILGRYFRMKGYATLHPMGWDAFGLPAENAAIKSKKNPMDLVPKNIANFKRQMQMLGLSYDWNRELATTDPNYYRITQWLFTLFFKLGLLYKKETPVYFCPFCKTGLAEEEVLPNGTHERCGNQITRKSLPQWIFRITTYADSLLKGLKGLDWPNGILEMQKNWIGRKEGVNITYLVINPKSQFPISKQIPNPNGQKNSNFEIIDKITVFTTRPDTNFGATFIVLAPEHKFVASLLNSKFKIQSSKLENIKKYVDKSLAKTDLERIAEGRGKTGVFTGFYAVNNLTERLMPVWISDFVLMDVGTGAVVGVPGHDQRDYEFAQEFDLSIETVVVPFKNSKFRIQNSKLQLKINNNWKEMAYDGEGKIINSGFLNGLTTEKAKEKIMDYLEEREWGKRMVTYHLRDWIFSRQRYWGEPIPMIYCKRCADSKISYWKTENFQFPISNFQTTKTKYQNTKKQDQTITERVGEIEQKMYGWFPLEEKDLPLKLPYLKHYEPIGTGESPLAKVTDWVNVKCPNCGSPAKRETDTMPNWAGSCWYFLAFSFWNNEKTIPKGKKINIGLLNMDRKPYVFGTLTDKIIQKNIEKWLPVDWYIGGAEHAVLHLLYSRFWMHILNDVGLIPFREPFYRLRNVGMVLAEDHHKMSKSLGNVINPDEVVSEYGADTLRVYEMFMAPFSQEIAWSNKTLQGAYRFLNRIWQTYHDSAYITNQEKDEDKRLVVELQRVIGKVSNDITDVKYNTAIAAMMKFLNEWEKKAENVGVIFKSPIKRANQDLSLQNQPSNLTTSNVAHAMKQFNNETIGREGKRGKQTRKLTVTNAKKFLQILSPFAPFITEEIWHEVFKEKSSIHGSSWPVAEKKNLVEEELPMPVQVNGKLRALLKISATDADQNTVVKKALFLPQVKKWIEGKSYQIIYVKGKILNLVVR